MGQVKAEALIVAGVALAVIYLTSKAASTVSAAASDLWTGAKDVAGAGLNPTSDQNYAYRFASWIAGGDLGTVAYDYVHKAEPDPVTGQLINYSAADAAKEADAIRRLENGMNHGL